MGHDETIDFERAAELVGDPGLMERVRDASIELYSFAAEHAREHGVILADTKFEFGLDEARRQLVVGDEVLTPDSSRYWPADGYEVGRGQPSFDKQYVRDWATASGWDKLPPAPAIPDDVVAGTRARYVEAYERITGEPFAAWLARAPGAASESARPDPPRRRASSTRRGSPWSARCPRSASRASRTCTSAAWSSSTSRGAAQLEPMCEKLLANPLVEDYEIRADSTAAPDGLMKFGVLQFPGSCDEVDALEAARHGRRRRAALARRPRPAGRRRDRRPRRLLLRRLPARGRDRALLAGDGVGDRVRRARAGSVLGICNGFQVLCEAHLLPGALLPNVNLRFTFRQVRLEVVERRRPRSPRACAAGERLSIPAKHSWGRYYADAETLAGWSEHGQVVLRYAAGRELQRLAPRHRGRAATRPATCSA